MTNYKYILLLCQKFLVRFFDYSSIKIDLFKPIIPERLLPIYTFSRIGLLLKKKSLNLVKYNYFLLKILRKVTAYFRSPIG